MAKYSDVFKAARVNLLALKLGTLLVEAGQESDGPLTVAQLEAIFDKGADYADEIGIREIGMGEGVVKDAIGKAFAKVLEFTDDVNEAEQIVNSLTPAFAQIAGKSFRNM